MGSADDVDAAVVVVAVAAATRGDRRIVATANRIRGIAAVAVAEG